MGSGSAIHARRKIRLQARRNNKAAASQALFEIRTCFSCRHDEPEPDFKMAVNGNSKLHNLISSNYFSTQLLTVLINGVILNSSIPLLSYSFSAAVG